MDTAYCIEGCGNKATKERLFNLWIDGDEISCVMELVCEYHFHNEPASTS